jgi:hypothetical protein
MMPAFTRAGYEQYLYALPETTPEIQASSLRLFTIGRNVGICKGSLWFVNGIELRVQEVIDLIDGEILDYSYTAFSGLTHLGAPPSWRQRAGRPHSQGRLRKSYFFNHERIRWYDPQPHPENEDLRITYPHHRHEPPDIKHNRRPAPGISFQAPNLPTLIQDCIELGKSLTATAEL